MGRRALGPNMRFSVRLTDIKPPSSDVRGCLGDGEGFPSLPSSPSPPTSLSGCPNPNTAESPAATRTQHWPRWPSPRAAAFREVCGAAVTSHQRPSPGAVTRLRSFAAEPVKESAIHSTGWAEPRVAQAPLGTGTSWGWGRGGKTGFRVSSFSF